MQPDPTPDLDELERLHRDASSPGQIVTSHKMTVWEFDLCCESRKALPWLLRAARERDELRAEMDALLYMPDASELPPPTPEQESRNAAIREIVLNPQLLAELRARAEKAEARAKGLEAAASPLLEFLRTLPEDALGRDAELGFAYRDQAIDSLERALAQKEPKP